MGTFLLSSRIYDARGPLQPLHFLRVYPSPQKMVLYPKLNPSFNLLMAYIVFEIISVLKCNNNSL